MSPTAIGPAEEGAANGVVDLLVETEAEAAQVARRYLSYFQGRLPPPPGTEGRGAADARQLALRHAVPSKRTRTYDMRKLITTLADEASWLELRGGHAKGMVSGLCRIDGHPLGVLANSTDGLLGGAIDSDGALKAARFMELCDAFELPLLFLCDTPGFMVGAEHERTAAVRKLSRCVNRIVTRTPCPLSDGIDRMRRLFRATDKRTFESPVFANTFAACSRSRPA